MMDKEERKLKRAFKKWKNIEMTPYKPPVDLVVVHMWESFWFSIVNLVKR